MIRPEDWRVFLALVEAGLASSTEARPTDGELAEADWPLLLASARRHRLSGLLFEGIRKLSLEASVPAAAWESLRAAYYGNLARNLALIGHTQELAQAAARLGAPLLLLKGAAFAGTLYPNLAMRPMADVDILVRRADAASMMDLARGLGYEPIETTDHATSLRHRGSGTYLELHTSLTCCPDYLGIGTEELLARSRPATPEPARTLSPEDHLLHLSLHGSFQHGFRQAAINACDAYLLSRGPELNWEGFLERARAPRRAPLVYGGLTISHRLFPSEGIGRALEALRPLTGWLPRRWVERLEPSDLLHPGPEVAPGGPWQRILFAPTLADALALIGDSLRPAPVPGEARSGRPSIRRGLALLWRHGLGPCSRGAIGWIAMSRPARKLDSHSWKKGPLQASPPNSGFSGATA